MSKLIYFSGLNLTSRAESAKEAGSLCSASLREREPQEKESAAQQMRTKMTSKGENAAVTLSALDDLEIDSRLKDKRAVFHTQQNLRRSRKKAREINESVRELVDVSMRNYYLAKMGDCIVHARNELRRGRQHKRSLANLKRQAKELLRAYNAHTAYKLSLEEIIPAELKPCWLGASKMRCA